MTIKLIKMSFLLILSIGLTKSSFFLEHYLTQLISKKRHNLSQLTYAVNKENIAALTLMWEQSEFHSKGWVDIAITLSKTQGEASYQLALFYKDNPEMAIFWFENAIRLKNTNAALALAQLYFAQEKVSNALNIIEALSSDEFETNRLEFIILKINIAIYQGNVEEGSHLYKENKHEIGLKVSGKLLLANIKKYQINLTKEELINDNMITPKCDNSIQLFATNLNHLEHLEKVINDIQKSALNQFVCFETVRYMPIETLECRSGSSEAIKCNELHWQLWAKSINSRYVGLMLPKGGANVHLGVLYFDSEDTVEVITHEISHLLGFVDEYPLVEKHTFCQKPQNHAKAQNVSVLKFQYKGIKKQIRDTILKKLGWGKLIKPTTPILQLIENKNEESYWLLGTPEHYREEIGVFKSKTCDKNKNLAFGAFKSTLLTTKLEYFGLPFPKLYLALLDENINKFRMPSFHYNIALAYYQQSADKNNDLDRGRYWIKQAELREEDNKRRKKIREGQF